MVRLLVVAYQSTIHMPYSSYFSVMHMVCLALLIFTLYISHFSPFYE